MLKKVVTICLMIISCLFCISASIDEDNIEQARYVQDGLVLDQDEVYQDRESLDQYKSQLDEYVTVVDNHFIVDYDSIESERIDEDVIERIKENVDFANDLAAEQPEIVTILQDGTLDFDIEDEYVEQWNAWQLSWSLWEGFTYKLDSDFGKLIGIVGVAYRLMSYIANGSVFYKKIMSITNQSELASTLSTLFFYLPGEGVKDLIATYLQNYVGSIAAGIVSVNLILMTLKSTTFGIGWLIFKFVDLVLRRMIPTLITSCSIIYNCFKYNSPIYCKISLLTASARYSLTKF